MITPFEKARILLSNMPEEVFTIWFDDRIKEAGWPIEGPLWERLLNWHSESDFAMLLWRKERIPLDHLNNLGERSRQIVIGLIEANTCGVINEYSRSIPDTKYRFNRILQYVMRNKNLPQPVILIHEGENYELLDGSHKLSVLFKMAEYRELYEYLPQKIEAWIAYKNDSPVNV